MQLEIPGFSNYYLETDNNKIYNRRGKQMTEQLSGDDFKDRRFLLVSMINDAGERKHVRKHRAVYMAHHPEEDISNLQINHLDEDPLNNDPINLRACTASENNNWGTANERRSAKMKGRSNTSVSVEVEATVLESGEIEYYNSVAEAARTMGVQPTSIWSAIDNEDRISVGRKWRRHHGG